MSLETMPIVSVVMITFKHEKFIHEAINGVLKQNYAGRIQLIIADDNSRDNTETVVRVIIENNTKENIDIQYTKHLNNKGVIQNFIWALEQAKGAYIALCDGDDYWIDPNKIKQQVKLLEENKNISICVHQVEKNSKLKSIGFVTPAIRKTGDYRIYDVLNHNSGFDFHTSSFIFRSSIIDFTLLKSLKIYSGDLAIVMMALNYGIIFYSEEVGAVYRVHEGGVTHDKNANFESKVKFFINMRTFFLHLTEYYKNKEYSKAILDYIKGLDFYISELYFQMKDRKMVRKYLSNALFFRLKTFKERKLRTIVVLFVYCYFPIFYNFSKKIS